MVTLTPRGWALAGAAAGLVVGSRVLGASNLAGLGIAAGLLLGFGAVWVKRQDPEIGARRSVQPVRLHVGAEGRVLLTVNAARSTPLLTLAERIDGGRRVVRFVMAPQAAGTELRAGYVVPTTRRGVQSIGPLVASVADPLGLVRRTWAIAETTHVVVCPRVHTITSPRRGGGGEPAAHADGPRAPALEPLGEFLTLRTYEPGDDPRRVHWRATARTGELLVRQDEAASPGRVILVLDTRRTVHTEASFETAVEVVASFGVQLRHDRTPIEVHTTAGVVLTRPGPNMVEMLLERLAAVDAGGPDHLGGLAASLRTRLGIGAVVFTTGAVDSGLISAATTLRARKLLVTVVATGPVDPTLPRAGLRLVDASGEQPFATVWGTAAHRPRGGTDRFRDRTWKPATSPPPAHSPR
jgi:uncharacterized protein (DUF58 family)